MKQPRNTILRENHHLSSTTDTSPSSTSPNPNNNSMKQKQSPLSNNRKQKWWSKENNPPSSDSNSMPPDNSSPLAGGKPSPATGKLKSPLPPRPPPSNPLKRKLNMETVPENGLPSSSDSGVKVIVRMRPPNKYEEEGDMIVQKVSGDSLSIHGQTFTFDSVADAESTQQDIYQFVGAPLVENCLAGFNSSVFAYGQTGSGKTYTIWGPANGLLHENLSSDQQGLTPRVFQQLFSRINEEQEKHADKQLRYQCRCSFLEIYNEQITDLLDPSQGNLQIREDVKTGVYVENLTEECVSTMKDVTQLLIKGLSNRRTGATSINAESSRSHSVFTCVVESRCKSVADGLSCFKTSRINLVDLAGSERQKLTGAAGERLKEAGNINRSLSQLGNLINILAEVSQTGKQRHIPYRDSKLTFLLQESLGGNSKLAMGCCKSETFSTLRFAQRAKAIKNKAIVNEEMQDDVNVLREVIRQLKDELLRMKANGAQSDPNGGHLTGWNARRSLNLLKFSLNRPMGLPRVDDDSDEEMEIIEEAVAAIEENDALNGSKTETLDLNSRVMVSKEDTVDPYPNTSESPYVEEQHSEDTDATMEEEVLKQVDKQEISVAHCQESCMNTSCFVKTEAENCTNNVLNEESPRKPVSDICENQASPNGSHDLVPPNLSIFPCDVSPVLESPTPSVSPRANNDSRKSLRTSSMSTASQKDLSAKPSNSSICMKSLSTQSSKSCFQPTDNLAASLHRGLEIIDSHRQSSVLRRSAFRFSYKPADIKPVLVHKVDVGVQTLLQDDELVEEDMSEYLCSKCKNSQEPKDGNEGSNMQLVPVDGSHLADQSMLVPVDGSHLADKSMLVPVDGSHLADKSMKQVPRAVEKVLAGAIRREMAIEEFCTKQNSEIMHLNRLVQQYKHERECNAIIGQTREDKIVRLESLMDGILSSEEFVDDELLSLKNEHMLLKEKYENHPEVLSTKIELKRVQNELERYRNFFDMGERDVLVEEIQDLRSQLQYYIDTSPKLARKRSPFLQLCEPTPMMCTITETTEDSTERKLELERSQWNEAESKWISLAEELRIELEANRSVTEKQKQELKMEKECSEELKEAMQMAMQGHARLLEQYVDLEEKHIQLLMRHRKMQEGIDDVKKAAAKAGVRGAESKFINALAAEISALKVEREKERRYLKDENKGLQAQLRDTAEAVQAAGELLVRLKEAEETVAAAQAHAAEAEQEAEKAYKQIDKLKKKHEKEITTLNQLLAESRLPKEAALQPPIFDDPVYDEPVVAKYDSVVAHSNGDEQWRVEFEQVYKVGEGEISKLAEPSWFSGYDRCNI
ncbi:hypothetical protein LguiA_002201 [Lonicera macranthoides]